jgi:hypothetical protein
MSLLFVNPFWQRNNSRKYQFSEFLPHNAHFDQKTISLFCLMIDQQKPCSSLYNRDIALFYLVAVGIHIDQQLRENEHQRKHRAAL